MHTYPRTFIARCSKASEFSYPAPVEEFSLSRIEVSAGGSYTRAHDGRGSIIIVLSGAGTIEAGNKTLVFERVLWRATRGNMYLRLGPGPSESTSVFLIVYSSSNVHSKISKICEAFG